MGNRVDDRCVEILAPAGSYESFLAAIRAGADAVYAGGPCFGARAFADNFSREELLGAIDYAHLHGRMFYLTVNTLLKDAELDRLYDYLAPLYERGLDAVIVQDIGVLDFVRMHFPGLSIHASTQMTITNAEGALFLKEQGVERVVPARELSLREVKEIADRTGIEVECFVHGALCYCYSGQCLLSSLIGGRSGNRGQCAQPCRLPYTVDGKKEHVLSLKDICTLEMIPELIEAGIDSFKIEGRMKKPEYVGLVTAMYRKYTDMYLKNGKKAFRVSEDDKEKLMDIYNRGGFSKGYYKQHNGKDMLSLDRPNHAGVPAIKVLCQKGREITGQAITEINKGDILELTRRQDNVDVKDNYTFGKGAKKGNNVQIPVPRGKHFSKGTVLYRLRNQALLDEIQELYGRGAVRIPVTGALQLRAGEPAVFTVNSGDVSVVAVSGELTEKAKSQPIDAQRLRKQLKKTGNTEFSFQNIDIEMEEPVFLPMQRINELRRHALELLTNKICARYWRRSPEKLSPENGHCGVYRDKKIPEQKERQITGKPQSETFCDDAVGSGFPPYLSALAESKEQLRVLVHSEDIRRIYMDSNISADFLTDSELKLFCRECEKSGKEFFLAMPHIFRQEAVGYFKAKCEAFLSFGFDGILIRNYESFHFLKEVGFDKKVILDHNLYVFNQQAKQFWFGKNVDAFTIPAELNDREIERLGASRAELIVYGRLPVMVSSQCIAKTMRNCTSKTGIIYIKDRCQKNFPVRHCCNFCYNVMYSTSVIYLADLQTSIQRLAPKGLRMQFTLEDAKETEKLVKACGDIYYRRTEAAQPEFDFTRGHFKRGIV